MRFQAASVKTTVFWDAALYHLIFRRRFRGVYCLHHRRSPDDGDNNRFLKVGQFLPDYYKSLPLRNPKFSKFHLWRIGSLFIKNLALPVHLKHARISKS
jgi:hypothetical protein